MVIQIDVLDASGNRLGDGPLTTTQRVSISRKLDGAGTFTATLAVDQRAVDLIQNERRMDIYADDLGGRRLIGQGIARTIQIVDGDGVLLSVRGPDILNDLKTKNALLARIYNQKTVSFVANSLIGLVPGWSVDVDAGIASDLVDARYDGASVLAALQDLARRYGHHLRLSQSASKTVEIGPLGQDSGLRLHKIQRVTPAVLRNDKLLMVRRLAQTNESTKLANWILPIGAGEGVAALTLEQSTRTSPYTIQSLVGPDGTTLYYLSDATSITAYGQIERVVQFKNIAPLTNTDGDIENAANALYDAAAAWLDRHSLTQERYGVVLKNVQQNIQVGDKVHIDYIAQIDTGKELIDYLNIRDDFWVLSVRESVGLDTHDVELEVSNVDRPFEDVTMTIVKAIESINLRNLTPKLPSTVRSFVHDREVAPSFPADIPLDFSDSTLSLQRIRFRLKTTPFRATATAAQSVTSAGGTFHEHVMFTHIGGANPITERLYNVRTSTGPTFSRLKGPAVDIWTEQDRTTHTHNIPQASLIFGITDDTVSPKNVTVFVNGVDKTTELFGTTPLAPTGSNLNVLADAEALTDLIVNASGGLRQQHEIEVRCAAQQGRIEATIEIFEVTQAVKIT